MSSGLPDPARPLGRLKWSDGASSTGTRVIAEECAVAITYNRETYAVMMASPTDLEDFAIGFSLSEAIIDSPAEIDDLEIIPHPDGIEARMTLAGDRTDRLRARRRAIAGPTGCGLCGMDSIAQAMRPPPPAGIGITMTAQSLRDAVADLPALQPLSADTRAVHAAGFWLPGTGITHVREDVGRHNALDKLAGALIRAGLRAEDGVILLTSRVSIEMVQKAARMGASILAAVSAPTALAIRMADAANITLAAIARADGFEVFTHPGRITGLIPAYQNEG